MICGECNGQLSSHIPAPGTLAQPARAVPDVVDLRIECATDDFIRHKTSAVPQLPPHRRPSRSTRGDGRVIGPPSREVKPAGKMIQRPATAQVPLVLLLYSSVVSLVMASVCGMI